MKNNNYNYAEVLVDSFVDLENQTFTYKIPDYLKNQVFLGTPVIIPLKENQVGGYIVDLHEKNPLSEEIKIKELVSASSEQILSKNYLELIKWIASYYHTSFLSVLKTAIPSGILTKAQKELTLVVDPEEFKDYIELQAKADFKDFCLYLLENPVTKLTLLKYHFGSKASRYIKKLMEIGYLSLAIFFENRSHHKKNLCIIYLKDDQELTKRETEVLAFIKKQNGYIRMQDVLEYFQTTPVLLRNLEKKQCVDISKQIILRKPQDYQTTANDTFHLNEHQQIALDEFLKIQKLERKNKNMLLYGVTGSGKTEVYIKSIEYILNQGKTAIVLVPEISLTPQTVSRFRERFGECIAVLHSSLNEGEKFDEWQRIKNGLAKIVIGARSAIFAPLENIGVIIIDEEHESSYKQDNNPKYNAKNVAMKRAELENATIILGSATPCIESYYNANSNENWKLLELPQRVKNQIMPKVLLVDMKKEYSEGNRGVFSRHLKIAIEERLIKKEQVILFLNRRGFSTFVLCRDCGYSVKCSDCSVAMVYHNTSELLKCHYCGKTQIIPIRCPSCKSNNIRHFGIGTQKIEIFAQKLFPTAKIARLDKDTTTKKDSHFTILNKFSKGEYDILIGTQMVAKGLDFPNVTLVGIITADTAINLPDFRAGEKTFQLITQVSGRSGRGDTKGEVIAQAYSLEHNSIQTASKHDFIGFYNKEIETRKELFYPPFSDLINIVIANEKEDWVKKDAKLISDYLKKNKTDEIIMILGAIPAALSKIKGFYRYQILIKTRSLVVAKKLISVTLKKLELNSSTKIGIDIDPLNIL